MMPRILYIGQLASLWYASFVIYDAATSETAYWIYGGPDIPVLLAAYACFSISLVLTVVVACRLIGELADVIVRTQSGEVEL